MSEPHADRPNRPTCTCMRAVNVLFTVSSLIFLIVASALPRYTTNQAKYPTPTCTLPVQLRHQCQQVDRILDVGPFLASMSVSLPGFCGNGSFGSGTDPYGWRYCVAIVRAESCDASGETDRPGRGRVLTDGDIALLLCERRVGTLLTTSL